MSKTITLGNDAYERLVSLKSGARDSFTQVILRHVRKPAETGGELLAAMADYTPPPVGETLLAKFKAGRGRRSQRA